MTMRSCPSLAALDTPLRLVEPSTDFDFEPEEPVAPPADAQAVTPTPTSARPPTAMVALVAAAIGYAAGRRFSGERARSRRRPR